MSLFVTGFLPWGSHELNPAQMAAEYAFSLGADGLLLPVSYEKVDEFFSRNEKKPDRILLFGLAAKRNKVSLERFAYNQTKPELLDVDGKGPKSALILDKAGSQLETHLDLDKASSALMEAGVPSYISFDAGRYLCNYAYFRALELTSGEALFVHLPPLCEGFDEASLRRTVEVLLSVFRD